MTTLKEVWTKHQTDKVTHWYLDFYEEILKDIEVKSLLEIGVAKWASIKMWREYFPDANIIWIDIRKPLDIEWCTIIQADIMQPFIYKLPIQSFDIIIDDGGHMVSQQKKAFNDLWDTLNPGGIYIMEDIFTSFGETWIDETPTTYDYLIEFCKTNNLKYKELIPEWRNTVDTLVIFKD